MHISKLIDTFKNQLNLPNGHYFITSSHRENALIPTQYPHNYSGVRLRFKSQILHSYSGANGDEVPGLWFLE